MRAFVTGMSGFVGGHLAEKLHSAGGCELIAGCRETSVLQDLTCSYELRRVDLFDPISVAECLRGADVIYHVAGATSGRSQEELDRANAVTTRSLLEARERAAPEALFVLLSSLSAAGPEESGGRPIGPYGRSKLLAESIVRRSSNWIIVRPPAVFGPRDNASAPLFRLANFPGLVVTPASRESLNWLVYVDDLVELLAMLPGCTRALGRTLTPAYREPVSWEDLVELLRRATGRRLLWLRVPAPLVRLAGLLSELAGNLTALRGRQRPVVFDRYKSREFLARSWRLDLDYTEELTGWSAGTPILEAFRNTLEYYKGDVV